MNEVRLIDANALKQAMGDSLLDVDACIPFDESTPRDYIDAAPTIDAEIVRHGRWSSVNEYCNHADQFSCSACNGSVFYNYYTRSCDYEYCPNCGAKMDAQEGA